MKLIPFPFPGLTNSAFSLASHMNSFNIFVWLGEFYLVSFFFFFEKETSHNFLIRKTL